MDSINGEPQPVPNQGELQAGHPSENRFWRKLRFYGLQGKLIIPYALLTLALAFMGTYVVTRLVTSSIRERFINQLYESSRVAADAIVRRERAHLEILRVMAYTEGVSGATAVQDATALQDLLLPLALNWGVESLTAIDLQGGEILTLGLNPATGQYLQAEGKDFSSHDLVRNILSGLTDKRGDKFTELLETRFGMALFTSAPVRDASGNLAGALLVGTRLDSLLAETKTQALADIILLDTEYQFVASTLAEPYEGYIALEEAAKTTEGGQRVPTQDLSLYGRDFQVAYTPFLLRGQQLGWLGVVLPSSYVVATEATSRNTFSLIFTLGTLAIIVIGYTLSQSIARPILQLRSLSQAVASGDLDQTIGLRRSDEIGELADAFDVMTLQLRERTAEAVRLYNETVQRNQELATINEQLQSMQLQLIQSEKLAAVGQLTAGIVHDVKNPLTVIKGMAELLQEDEQVPDDVRNELKVIQESAVKANRIVTDLLKFARQSKPELKRQNLLETVDAALRLTAYLIREARVQMITDLPDKPVKITYDSQQIEQVFVNLIANAVQAMPERGTLRVSLSQADRVVAIAFQDTGTGIPPENLRRIFDPFFTTKPEGEGTGLGLSVSYGIVSNHQGHIEVESTVGEGTTFIVLLPVKQPVEKAQQAEEN